MTRPHESLGLPQPLGRRLPQGLVSWNIVLLALMLVSSTIYVIQVNRASMRGFHLREVERHLEAVRSDVMALDDRIATLSSVQSLTQRADQLGLVSADRLEFVNPASKSYAVR